MIGLREAETMETGETTRKSLLAKVHIAKKELGLTDLVYRQYLWRWFAVRSAGDLTDAQLERLVDIYKLNGWKPKPGREARELKRSQDRASYAQLGMIRGLWRELGRAGKLHNPTDDGLSRFIKKTTHVDRLEWLTIHQAGGVIEALKAWAERAGTDSHTSQKKGVL